MNRNTLRQSALVLAAAAASVLPAATAFAQTNPATAEAALTSLGTGTGAYGPIMWGIAVIATGIMIGVKWVKRGRGAA